MPKETKELLLQHAVTFLHVLFLLSFISRILMAENGGIMAGLYYETSKKMFFYNNKGL